MKRNGHFSHFSAENHFSNTHVQHLKPSCHHISHTQSTLNWKFQLNRFCYPVAVKQKLRCRVKPNTLLQKKSTLERGSESRVMLRRLCSLSSKSDVTPANSENEQIFFISWKEPLYVSFDMCCVCVCVSVCVVVVVAAVAAATVEHGRTKVHLTFGFPIYQLWN